MQCLINEEFKKRVGLDDSNFTQGSLAKIDKDTGIIHFFPAKFPSKNFSKFVKNPEKLIFSDPEITFTIQKYTNHDTWYCSKINLLLASDSPDLKDHSLYISQLRHCIRTLAQIHPITEKQVYRGYECSLEEFNSYGLYENIYIPSFLSSSKNKGKFYQAKNHNTLMVINLRYTPNNAFVVGEKYSVYAGEEEEVLFSCSKFKVVKKGKNVEFCRKKYEFYLEMEHINENGKGMEENVEKMVCFNFFFK